MPNLTARRYDTLEPIRIEWSGEQIESISPADPATNSADLPIVAPAFFDHQINGFGGVWFSDETLTVEQAVATAESHFQFGITRMFPTLITNSFEALQQGFTALRLACEQKPWVDRMLPGFHLEGPYLSAEDGPRGAHPRDQIRPADWDEFARWQEAAGGRIRLVTVAPEVEGAIDFIRQAVKHNVAISIGHTAASTEDIAAAVDAGATMSTHLGNGAHGMLKRHPNYIWDQLGDERLMASIISDGHHLPESVTRTIVKTKTPLRTIITCDASGLVGYPPGVYDDGTMAVEIKEDGRIVLAGQDQLLAGSACETDHCVAQLIKATGVRLSEAIDMAGRNPARLLGFDPIRLRRGSRADMFLFHYQKSEHKFAIATTVVAGEVRFGTIPEL